MGASPTVDGMKNTALTRSVPYWLLLALSVIAIGVGGWLTWDKTDTMETTLLDGTATNVEVYVGQAWITAGSALLAAGAVGLFLALALGAVKAVLPKPAVEVVEAISWAAPDDEPDTVADAENGYESDFTDAAADESATADEDAVDDEADDQNGSSGSSATATKISVK